MSLNMKIDYIRNLNASHMILEQAEEMKDWERQMLVFNKIEGMLLPDHVSENGEECLWYNITGKQSLDIIAETVGVNYDMLCSIFTAIFHITEKLEALLLPIGNLILRPECVFLDHKTDKIIFCYFPGREQVLYEAFGEFMEFILTKLDHADERAVTLAYDIYNKALKEGFSLNEIQKLICFSYAPEEEQQTMKIGACIYEGEKAEELQETDLPHADAIRKTKRNIWAHFFKRFLPKGTFSQRQNRKRKRETESFVFEPENVELSQAHPTVLLSELTKKTEGILKYEGNGACTDLKIEKCPYIIGNDTSTDGCIPSSTISKRHARITRTEDIYFIEDLNSTNGTFVGGELLNYKVKMSLQKNETIVFADEKFRFI